MNVDEMIDAKMDVLIEHMKKHKEGRVDQLQLMGLLDKCYTDIIPPVAKMFVRRGRFISLLMDRQKEIMQRLNAGQASFLSIVN